jgi:hypothetical protein
MTLTARTGSSVGTGLEQADSASAAEMSAARMAMDVKDMVTTAKEGKKTLQNPLRRQLLTNGLVI